MRHLEKAAVQIICPGRNYLFCFCSEKSEETRDFAKYLTEYSRNDGSLLASSQLELQTLYRSQLTSSASSDVYRKCLLAIMSRSESDIDLPSVTNSVNDWLWIKLAQAEPALSTSSSQNLTLPALQQMVLAKFPPQKTSDTEAFLAFTLTGQFELAVERLFLNVKLRAHAVNMAICLKQVWQQFGPSRNEKRPSMCDLSYTSVLMCFDDTTAGCTQVGKGAISWHVLILRCVQK